MVQLDIVKGEIEETVVLDTFDKALELLKLLTGGAECSSMHKNRMIFGEGKDAMIITTTNINESSEEDIKRLIDIVRGSSNEASKPHTDSNVDREKIINEFKKVYNQFAILVAYNFLTRDVNFISVCERIDDNLPLDSLIISQDSYILKLKGFSEYIGVEIISQSNNGSVVIKINKDISRLVSFITKKFNSLALQEYKDNAMRTLSLLPEYIDLAGISLITDSELAIGAIRPEHIQSKENLTFLHELGFVDGQYSLYYPINYNKGILLPDIAPTSNVENKKIEPVNKTMESFSNIKDDTINNSKQEPEISPEDRKIGVARFFNFRQALLRYTAAMYLSSRNFDILPEDSELIGDKQYNFRLFDKYQDVKQILSSIAVKISNTDFRIIAPKMDKSALKSWLLAASKASVDNIGTDCMRSLSGHISDETSQWLREVIKRNIYSEEFATTLHLRVGDMIPSDFFNLLKLVGAEVTKDSEYVVNLSAKEQ